MDQTLFFNTLDLGHIQRTVDNRSHATILCRKPPPRLQQRRPRRLIHRRAKRVLPGSDDSSECAVRTTVGRWRRHGSVVRVGVFPLQPNVRARYCIPKSSSSNPLFSLPQRLNLLFQSNPRSRLHHLHGRGPESCSTTSCSNGP